MSLKSRIVKQFQHPSGLVGALAGRIMAGRPSNRSRNAATVELMHLRPDSRVLEIGCGPGLALSACASIVTNGRVVGIDHSDVMIRQAHTRLHRHNTGDRVELVTGGIDLLSEWPEAFDCAFSLNVVQFQRDKTAFYNAISNTLIPGGSCLTTYQPRLAADAQESSRTIVDLIEDALIETGFGNLEKIEIIGGATPAVCVIGWKPVG